MKKTPSLDAKPTREQIAVAAYHLYLEGGRQDGHELEHWHRAEQLLNEQFTAAVARQSIKQVHAQKTRPVALRHTSRRPAWLIPQISGIF
ncbi:MAG: DUF2934 domain-containing protein [Limisphaerales bacterium]